MNQKYRQPNQESKYYTKIKNPDMGSLGSNYGIGGSGNTDSSTGNSAGGGAFRGASASGALYVSQ
jgi:hypothetical protein